MRSPAAYLFAVLVGAIIWFFFQYFKIEGTDTLRVVPKEEAEINQVSTEEKPSGFSFSLPEFLKPKPLKEGAAGLAVEHVGVELKPRKSPESIRIASFRLRNFGNPDVDQQRTQQVLLKIIRQFDLVALQGLHQVGGAAAVSELGMLAGKDYDVVVGRLSAVQHQDQQFAYIYNQNTIVADRSVGLYTLGDPDDLLAREPLIGWFRAKEAPAEEAFTFTLVNVHTDQRRVRQELNVLDNVITEVRADGRDEDDVLLLGCLQARDDHLFQLGDIRGFVAAIRALPTNLEGTSQTENIVFQDPETDEFHRITGVFDYPAQWEISQEEAAQISPVLPVWAEFSIFEGGRRRLARAPTP